MILIGPFHQLVTLDRLPLTGPIQDDQIEILTQVGVLIEKGQIKAIDDFNVLKKETNDRFLFDSPAVAIPGIIDAHTHICFGGNRVEDYALRTAGVSYQEITARGGGIQETVLHTRATSKDDLTNLTLKRLNHLLKQGITTCEIKSGYGLSVAEELKILEAIHKAAEVHPINIIPTCLAAHVKPSEYRSNLSYLHALISDLFPCLKTYTQRIDIFVEKGAFSPEEALFYLQAAKQAGFTLTLHANQFGHGGAQVAAQMQAASADHLEYLNEEECLQLKGAGVVAVALPGACLGLGVPFPPARKMLDCGLSLAVASDWNPGSAPMGNLVAQASVLGMSQKLTLGEILAAVTLRAAHALRMQDRGSLKVGNCADLTIYPCVDWREIFYYQGSLLPTYTVIRGQVVTH